MCQYFWQHTVSHVTDNITLRVMAVSCVKVSIHLPVTAWSWGEGIWRFPCLFVITAQTCLPN